MERMLSSEDIKKINSRSVLVFGLGGVGGSCVEALIRSGVEKVGIVDGDEYEITNLNRQIFATMKTIGIRKVDACEERMLEINPKLKIKKYDIFVTEENICGIDFENYDYVVDAIDTITSKLLIIRAAYEKNIKIISAMGAGNRLDPTKFEVVDIEKTKNDPVARIIRKKLKEMNIKKLKVVCSKEIPIKTHDRTPGSISFVPPVCGMVLASYVISDILKS
ncbi:tRNA threonylcarbamoyladenosine dehydratase [Peptoniphilus sp. AGMB00490]|uniref:tRNA threonylcarbamoyladenosine dehydratase n=3 Tax=Peptoniphilaceae TaxID=1570339 RepID=A0ACD6B045_9FIRM|nr:tRNA threonylcarbamoyladenosine dehydratase [Peptoniphilus faecalis]OLR65722.1 tRNA threonylcarbamoyladenosine dehydratase [Peptoniphilus porci]